ncbi:16S rRNA (guanine(966)-N(2))-methyltransferase RsmD [bacterium]|nr:16S rRNA (guanine(966)-N(2))-methyltransferase RsmD [bacterium]
MNITAGKYKGRKVTAPDEKIVRPTLSKVRESIFNVLYSMVDFEGSLFLDMFAGSGIMGLEAISRGFEEVWEIEKNLKVSKIVKENYATLGIKPKMVIGDSIKKIFQIGRKFDVIFIDPPYYSGIYEDSLNAVLESESLNPNGIIVLEHVEDVEWEEFGLKLIKQKKYSDKFVTFLSQD